MNNKTGIKEVRPFLRWAGGKTWLTKAIEKYIPLEFGDYYEPFVGGGAMFFYLKSNGYIKNRAFLSDSNKDLINTYKVLKNDHEKLFEILKTHFDSEEEYYRIRETEFDNSIEKAAKFLYLNKTSFNGIYRVNKSGKYNVPYGRRNLKTLYDFTHLLNVSKVLQNTFLSNQDFRKRSESIRRQDFVFLDPPYTVAHENNGFIQYNQSIFSWENQIQLSNLTERFDENGIYFIVTNAFHDCIKEIYKIGDKIEISRSSTIGGVGAKRTRYKEYIITNINN